MYLLRIDGQAAKLLRIVSIVMIGELFIRETSATYFIELTDKSEETMKITLYECNFAPEELRDSGELPLEIPNMPATLKQSEVPTNNDVMCKEVPDGPRKQRIYRTANFFLVSSLQLEGGSRFFKPMRSEDDSCLLSQEPADAVYVGVTIFDSDPYDYPALVETDDDEAIEVLRDTCYATEFAPNILYGDRLDEFLLYLTTDDFHSFLQPTQKMIDQFKLFFVVTDKVYNIYRRDVFFARENKVFYGIKEQSLGLVKSAAGILTQKLLDPCLVLKRAGTGKAEAEAACKNVCRFLAVGFVASRVAPDPSCGGSLKDGYCDNNDVCWCKNGLENRTGSSVRMVKCSNELRTGIAKTG